MNLSVSLGSVFFSTLLSASALASTTPAGMTLSSQTTSWALGPTQSASSTLLLGGKEVTAGNVQLVLEGAQAGTGRSRISASFGAQNGASRTWQLTVGPEVPVGTYPLVLRAKAGSSSAVLPLQVKVERWLLVDADRSENNTRVGSDHRPDPQAKDSALDSLIKTVVAGKVFDTYVVKQGSMTADTASIVGPDLPTMTRYSHVLWYTGSQDYQTPVDVDYEHMRGFIQKGSRRLVLISPAMVLNLGGAANVFQTTSPDPQDPPALARQKSFLNDVFGIAGYHGTYARNPYPVTPVAGSRAASVAPFQAAGGNSIRAAFKPQEDGASRSLLTAPVQDQRDVTSAGSIAIRRTGTGDAQSSSAIFLGVSPDVFQLSNPVRLLRLMFLE